MSSASAAPAREDRIASAVATTAAMPAAGAVGARQVILVVDDTPECLFVLGQVLRPFYEVRVANSGRRAIEVAIAQPPDLVLLDVLMPDLDGYGVLRALRANPRTCDVPVIFVTALDAAEDEQRGLDLGAADYIVKPLQPPVVLARVHTQLALKAARDGLRAQNVSLAAEVQRRARAEDEVRALNAVLQTRTAALERSIADLEAFSYSVSHDLRAPLRAVSGYAEILRESAAERMSAEDRQLVDRVTAAARRMNQMIEDILCYSRTERSEMNAVAVDLSEVAAEVVQEIAPVYRGVRIDLAPLPVVLADPTMMRQVLANLIGNACKFSAPCADPRVQVGVTTRDGEVEICVGDNGVGFAAEDAGRLFGLFQRLHGKKEFPGTGAGLAIVRRLVERHGGRVGAESSPGKGTTFRFTLPARTPEMRYPPVDESIHRLVGG